MGLTIVRRFIASQSVPAQEPVEKAAPSGSDGEVRQIHAEDLRQAYDALASAVSALSKDGGAVRDSEVKRRLMADDGGFDEGALGFRKFSRFLLQARDEGVIDLAQGEDGNYYLSPVDAPPAKKPHDSKKDRRERQEESGRPKVRDESPKGKRNRKRTQDEPAPQKDEAAPQKDEAAPQKDEAAPQKDEAAPQKDEAAKPAKRGGVGRFRRGSRGRTRPEGEKDVSHPTIGPVDSPAVDTPAEVASDPVSETGPPLAMPDDRTKSGVGRFRKGSRGRGGQASAARPAADTSTPAGSDTAPVKATSEGMEDSADTAAVINHMVRAYSGVGRRTAERLVEEFGAAVYEVIDNDPARLSTVLSERRAQAVISAREAERAAG